MERDSLAFEIVDTARALRRHFDQRATSIGVTRAQWRVLSVLNRQPNLKQVELAEILDIEPITLCRQIDRLEEAGLVVRQRDPADRRAFRLALTQEADPILARLRTLVREFAAEAFADLDDEGADRLAGALIAIRDRLSGGPRDERLKA